MRLLPSLIKVIGLVIIAKSALAQTDVAIQLDHSYKIRDAVSAVSTALTYTGFDADKNLTLPAPEEMATFGVAYDSTTPFLSNRIDGTEVWTVRFERIIIETYGSPEHLKMDNPKDFDVIIDAKSGQLLKVISKFEGFDPDLAPEPPTEMATEEMKRMHEKYLGFPENTPNTSFFKALSVIPTANPHLSKEIIGLYVNRSHMDSDPKPEWCITLKGFPPMSVYGPGTDDDVPVHMCNFYRNIIDDQFGRFVRSVTWPQMPKGWKPDED